MCSGSGIHAMHTIKMCTSSIIAVIICSLYSPLGVLEVAAGGLLGVGAAVDGDPGVTHALVNGDDSVSLQADIFVISLLSEIISVSELSVREPGVSGISLHVVSAAAVVVVAGSVTVAPDIISVFFFKRHLENFQHFNICSLWLNNSSMCFTDAY